MPIRLSGEQSGPVIGHDPALFEYFSQCDNALLNLQIFVAAVRPKKLAARVIPGEGGGGMSMLPVSRLISVPPGDRRNFGSCSIASSFLAGVIDYAIVHDSASLNLTVAAGRVSSSRSC